MNHVEVLCPCSVKGIDKEKCKNAKMQKCKSAKIESRK